MGAFDGLGSAKVYERSNPLVPGYDYELEIIKCIKYKTFAKGDAFIVEFTVLGSKPNTSDNTVGPTPNGVKSSWYQGMSNLQVAFGEIKAFLYAALGYDFSTQKAECAKVDAQIEGIASEAVDETKNALKGSKLSVSVKQVLTKEKKPFSRHTWSHKKG